MRLLVDSTLFGSPGGQVQREELVRWLGRRARAGDEVVHVTDESARLTDSAGVQVVRVSVRPAWRARWAWYRQVLPALAAEHGADAVFTLNGLLSRQLCRDFATVTAFNNMEPFSEGVLRQRRRLSKGRLRVSLLLRAYRRSAAGAGAVVMHSTHSLDRVTRLWPEVAAKAFVSLMAPARDVVEGASRAGEHPLRGEAYLLYLSSIYHYKNHLGLVEAYDLAWRSGVALPPLVIAGPAEEPEYLARVLATARRLGQGERVRYAGVVEREDVARWLHHARVNLHPSCCESFGLGVVEVLCAGGVLACSAREPMLETAAYAAEFFDPHSGPSMARVLTGLHGDARRRGELRMLARRRSAELSWRRCADTTWEAVRFAVRGRPAACGQARPCAVC